MVKNKTVRTFITRFRKLTEYQEKFFRKYWQVYGINLNKEIILDSFFEHHNPIVLDIGFGCGDNLVWQAHSYPHFNFVGVEVYLPGIRKVLYTLSGCDIANLKLVYNDINQIIPLISQQSISRVQIYFPDPWPKRRHHKRRLINEDFIVSLHSIMLPNSILHIKTDIMNYADIISRVFSTSKLYHVATVDPYNFALTMTKYENKGLAVNRKIWDLKYVSV